MNYYVFHVYIIRDEKDDFHSTHVKKLKPVSRPSHDDICTVNHQSKNMIKYKVLTEKQNSGKHFSFPEEQFGTKQLAKSHMRSFSLKWLEEFGPDGLCYSVYEDAAYCKFCRLFSRWRQRSISREAILKVERCNHLFQCLL